MDQNPEKIGMPAIANQATTIVMKVTGIALRNPPILCMSCSPAMAWITEPAPRNSSALKKAWVSRWNIPAT